MLFLNKYLTIEQLIGVLFKIIGILLVLIISHYIIKRGHKFVDKVLLEKNKYINERKKKTLQLLMKSIFRYGMYFLAGVIILYILDIPIGSLLAGAGIVGVAFGFGAQSLVKDVINGFFILFEDQFGVGDYIKTAERDGIVEQIGLRTTEIRAFDGELHIIPNGEIKKVTNYSTGDIRVLVDVGISYEEDIKQAISVLENMCEDIAEEKNDIITEKPTVMGVQELASSSVVIRVMARAKPMSQWQLKRYIRQRAKEVLNQSEIEIPYPHLVLLPEGEGGNSLNE